MAGFNSVTLVGNLTREPELRYTPSGAAVADLRLAVNRTYVVNGEKREEVLFVTCVAWGKTAEAVTQYLGKGSQCLVHGRLQSRDWETKAGEKRTTIEVVAESVVFLGAAKERRDAARSPALAPEAAFGPGSDDDVPF